MGSVIGHKDWLINNDIVRAGALEAHDEPGIFDLVVRARYQKGAVAFAGYYASQQGPVTVR